jgi:alkanesulfonate monooxygenase SsuD/methylene tetrahydromethanopterin reductase-like flavin-dependent oxidoreductase (luciferase family)
MYDPWVVMTAIALRTSRVTIGALVTPPARRRPWKLAREAMSVDVVSDGRLVLPIGLGALDDGGFGRVGEPTEKRALAERMDESLAILAGLWSGEAFGFRGEHYAFEPMHFRPRPVQRPRIPIWVVGAWPSEKSMARVARWDGLLPQKLPAAGEGPLTPADLRAMAEFVRARRGSLDGFEIVMDGNTDPAERRAAIDAAETWREAGATWWIEQNWADWSPDLVRKRIEAGPPRP